MSYDKQDMRNNVSDNVSYRRELLGDERKVNLMIKKIGHTLDGNTVSEVVSALLICLLKVVDGCEMKDRPEVVHHCLERTLLAAEVMLKIMSQCEGAP